MDFNPIPVSIGNDIVDLARQEPARHERFVSRVFADTEQELVRSSTRQLWLHWAAKEAAYKTIKRLSPSVFFSPRQFVFDSQKMLVRYAGAEYHCKVESTEGYIAVLCSNQIDCLSSDSFFSWIERANGKDPSCAVRELAREKLAAVLAVEPAEIEFGRLSGAGLEKIPAVYLGGVLQQMQISFSHHGRFVSCCAFL